MTTPIYSLDELTASQSQPHVPVNSTFRALEALVSRRVSDKDLTTPPGSPSNGDRYIVAPGSTDAWAGLDHRIVYYSDGWESIIPETGMQVYVVDEDLVYTYAPGSPTGWVPTADLASLTAEIDALQLAILAAQALITTLQSDLDTAESAIDAAEAEIDALQTGYVYLPFAIPGKPTAGALYNIAIPVAMSIPAALAGAVGIAGVPATTTATFTLYKNGVSVGTVTFGAGSPGDTPTFAAASQINLAIGDILAIQAPVSQDTTMADVGFTIRGSRT